MIDIINNPLFLVISIVVEVVLLLTVLVLHFVIKKKENDVIETYITAFEEGFLTEHSYIKCCELCISHLSVDDNLDIKKNFEVILSYLQTSLILDYELVFLEVEKFLPSKKIRVLHKTALEELQKNKHSNQLPQQQ